MLENVVDDECYLTRSKLLSCYLPFAAAKADVASNAKVSILLESLVRSMRRSGLLDDGVDVQSAVRKGVERRVEVSGRERRGRVADQEEEELAGKMLRESGWALLRAVGAKEVDEEWEGEDTTSRVV